MGGVRWICVTVRSIVIYTFFVKILTYPFQLASTRSMTLMKVTAPKINKINAAAFLSNEQKMQMTGKIYEIVGSNPLSGCLPVLATFPIYFTLISAWRRLAYEKYPYYTEGWLWVPSLAQPNPDFRLSVDWLSGEQKTPKESPQKGVVRKT